MGYLKELSVKDQLHAAARARNLEQVKLLLDEGISVNYAPREHGETALYAAAVVGDVEMVRFLLSRGADTEVRAQEGGRTALHVAAQYGQDEVVELLLQHGADAMAKTSSAFKPLCIREWIQPGATALDLARMIYPQGRAVALLAPILRRKNRLEFLRLRWLREQDRAELKQPSLLDVCGREVRVSREREQDWRTAYWLDMVLTLGQQMDSHTSESLTQLVLEFADW